MCIRDRASIAAVSQVELITKTADSLSGVRYTIDGGVPGEVAEIGAPEGTTFIVRNLFYNTPVRRKFLKTATTEGGYIGSLVEYLALSHPDISFRFISNNQNKLHTSGNMNLKDIIYNVYGRDITNNLYEISGKSQDIEASGFIGKPMVVRGNRTYENYYINGRYIKSSIITKAIEDAYKGFIMPHNYPFSAIHFKINPAIIDVNVHPTKQEVRFTDEKELRLLITETIRKVLMKVELVYEVDMHHLNSRTANPLSNFDNTKLPPSLQWDDFAISEPREVKTIKKDTAISMDTSILKDETDLIEHAISQQHIKLEEEITQPQFNLRNNFKSDFFQTMQYLGQYNKTYLLLEKEESLYLIDQHAAMELSLIHI